MTYNSSTIIVNIIRVVSEYHNSDTNYHIFRTMHPQIDIST
jgi:hypothetical protein